MKTRIRKAEAMLLLMAVLSCGIAGTLIIETSRTIETGVWE